MERPVVMLQPNSSHALFLRKLVENAFRGNVHSFDSLEEMNQYIKNHRVRMVFLDLRKDSDDLVTWVKSCDEEIIGIIGWTWSSDQLRPYLEAGLSDYVFKPLQPKKIIRLVEKRLEALPP